MTNLHKSLCTDTQQILYSFWLLLVIGTFSKKIKVNITISITNMSNKKRCLPSYLDFINFQVKYACII